ncbi:MAG: ribonuclease HI [Elusimicrobia bacterium]|nr:ribonuclease HI [Elusimicrobiota bacterium]
MSSKQPAARPGAWAVAFTDGACLGNPGPGGWGVVILTPGGLVRELGGRQARSTNNRMELTAAIEALRAAPVGGEVSVRTDSSYLVHGMTRWLAGWKRKAWVRPDGSEVLNRDLWEGLEAAVAARGRGLVRWAHVRGHAGVPGNERADAIAAAFAEGRAEPLYEGPVAGYGHDLSVVAVAGGGETPALSRPGPRRAPASCEPGWPVYLSLVGGRLSRHASWPACEAAVKGMSGAKFKKVRSSREERETLSGWGL